MKKETLIQVFNLPIPDTTALERQVLADAVTADYAFGDVLPIISPDFFTSEERRAIWETLCQQYNEGKGLTIEKVFPIIGQPLIDEVLPSTTAPSAGTGSGFKEDAELLRAGAAKRRAYFAAASFIQASTLPHSTEQDILTNLEIFTRQVEGPAPLNNDRTISQVLADVKEDAKRTEKARQEGRSIRITTGFKGIDYSLLGGMKPGQLVVLAARPSVGKSAVMLQMAKAAAAQGNPVQVFTLEMPDDELGERLLYSTGLVRPLELSQGTINWEQFNQAQKNLEKLPIYISDKVNVFDEILSRMTQAVKKGRCKVAFIDYLGLIQDAVNFGNAKLYQVIARITGTLKTMAKRLEIPIVLLCQMNRDQAREKRSPELYDLRDSGSIEQDADIVLMLEPKPEEGRIYAWLRKNRGGKRDIGFTLIPNETYSEFEEGVPVHELQPPTGDGQEVTSHTIPEPAPAPAYVETTTDINDLPF